MPSYAHIVPNQCNEMHGRRRAQYARGLPLRQRPWTDRARRPDDRRAGRQYQASPIWSAPGNTAIVITWDEDDDPPEKTGTQGCCGFDPDSPANFGGGHIPTIVITNHGPRAVSDDTPYNHYSLLRTTETRLLLSPANSRHAAEHRGRGGRHGAAVLPHAGPLCARGRSERASRCACRSSR